MPSRGGGSLPLTIETDSITDFVQDFYAEVVDQSFCTRRVSRRRFIAVRDLPQHMRNVAEMFFTDRMVERIIHSANSIPFLNPFTLAAE